jgi:hypothetical protein
MAMTHEAWKLTGGFDEAQRLEMKREEDDYRRSELQEELDNDKRSEEDDEDEHDQPDNT